MLSKICLLITSLALGGCCYVMPCHPGTYIAGTVADSASGQAITNATVRLYQYKAGTGPSGCFSLGGADALPFEFGVSAPGYKPLVVEATPGTYQAAVTLVKMGGTGASSSQLDEISRDRYAQLCRLWP